LERIVKKPLINCFITVFTRELFIRIFYLYFDLVQMRSVILCNKRIMYVCVPGIQTLRLCGNFDACSILFQQRIPITMTIAKLNKISKLQGCANIIMRVL